MNTIANSSTPAKESIDVMIDLETIGTGEDSAIAAIGAVVFDRVAGSIGRTFYRAIDIATSVRAGGVIDVDTFKWWMGQSEEARRVFEGKAHIEVALLDFVGWLEVLQCEVDDLRLWGNGSDFDVVILRRSCRRSCIPTPWKFWNVRCFRTLKAEHPEVPFVRIGIHHDALDDAISQARHVLKIDEATGQRLAIQSHQGE